MGLRAEQLEKGVIRKYIPSKIAKTMKKWRNRKTRRQAKKTDQPHPLTKRYDGWVM